MEDILAIIREELLVMMLAATPISELRGAIPVGISLGLSPLHSAIISVIGNSIPVPFLLLLLKPIFNNLGSTKGFGGLINWLKRRTLKRSKNIKKYSVFGLYLLVAIPLPTTGAWTGCLAATLFNIRFRHAFIAIILGIMTSGIIVLTLSHQVTSIL
ncbi:COG2426 family protein [Brassicibacter mesophilus]|uniref:COG2426 family protein n=1 Tax=Brassicibacter mesophilus TaxID=745119 RepID=UPI003D21F392